MNSNAQKSLKGRIVLAIITVAAVAALMLTLHVLVHQFNLFEVLKGLHGG